MIYGAKKGQNQQQKPKIAKDDLVSTSYFKGLYGLAEGEIAGLADGGKSIRLDGTPIVNDNGQANFDGVTWDFRTGTLDQEHIAGFSAVENERNVGVELRHDKPYVQAINNVSLSAVRLRLNFNALREQKDNGDITGYAIEYAIDVQTDGGAFTQVLNNTVRGKASQGFKKSHRIELPKASKNWTIRVRRITRNRDSDLIADTVSIDAITEIIDAKLRYPATALLGLTYDATTFSNIAKIAVRLKGKLIKVPSNYDPVARTYSGLWDGTFKLAYSNNPAWVLYDICTHKRYGLGERLSNMVDKWRLYQIGQYCDEPVDDGKGGKEPRFAINVYIQKDDDAYKVIQNIASVFRGLSYWDGTQVIVDSDTPKDPVYTFSPANIVGGEFSYTGTRQRDRHTVVKAAWDNPDNDYKTEYELIRDEQGIAKYGIRMLDISVFGCTSQAQAQRAGLWALKSEQLETRTVSFKTGLQGFIPQVGQIINIADNVFAGRAISGRVVSHNAQTVTLDRTAGKVGDSIVIGKETAKITRVDGQVITTDKALDITDDAVWAIVSDDLRLMQFRILTIAQNDDATFSITALQYEPQKYDAIDSGAVITPKPITALTATPVTAPSSVTISQSVRTHQNQSVTTMTINWTQVQGAVAYRVRWRKDDGNWQTIAKISGQSVDIDGVYSGNYIAEVQAIDAFDNESLATTSELTTITGKIGKPPRPARITAVGKLFGMDLTWSFNAGSDDTNYTEIQVSPDGRSNITTLGTFAYPTDKHTINGLQGNLTQFYRARIVDKLGNVSDWTAWTSGTTEAQADKVLSLLTGQITASQLHQDLSTPIGKIGTLENSLNTAKIDLSALNASMTTAKADIAKAKTDLNTAISNITTERNRISLAIADITALQSANNAKTAEIANLTQTVGGHTSSIRDLAVTTGDLTQKYTQLKTASDNANAEITSIKQTQAGQATQISTLGSRFDSLSVGGRNLLRNSKLRQRAARDHTHNYETYTLTTSLNVGDSYAFSALVEFVSGQSDKVTVYDYRGGIARHLDVVNGRINTTFVATSAEPTSFLVYAGLAGSTNGNALNISNAKLEKGNIATDWSPAPEDIDAQFVQTNANISTLQQTVTNADNALSSRIDSLSSDYNSNKSSVASQLKTLSDKDTATASQLSSLQANVSTAQSAANTANSKADTATTKADNAQATANNALSRANTANSAITTEQTARADADTALSQRITQLDSAYKSADSALSARIATAEQSITTANQAIATTQETLMAKMDVIDTNLVISGSVSSANYNIARFNLAKAPKHGEAITITLWGELGADRTHFGVYNSGGGALIGRLVQVGDGMYQLSAPWTTRNSNGTQASNTALWVYQFASTATSTSRIDKISLVYDTQAQATSAVQANLDEFKTAQASKDNATAQSISTLQTTVNGQTASIEQHSQSINGLSAQWTLKAESNGIVSGIGLASSNGVSDFAVRANKFYVVPPTGTTKQPLFSVLTTPTTVGGVSVPAGVYLSSAYIQNGTITNAKIANGAITTAKIGNAQIGNAQIANGAITTAKIGTAQVDTLQIAGEAVIVPRALNAERRVWNSDTVNEVVLSATMPANNAPVVVNVHAKATVFLWDNSEHSELLIPQLTVRAVNTQNGKTHMIATRGSDNYNKDINTIQDVFDNVWFSKNPEMYVHSRIFYPEVNASYRYEVLLSYTGGKLGFANCRVEMLEASMTLLAVKR